MPDLKIHPLYSEHRALVRLRVPMSDTDTAARVLDLPAEPLSSHGTEPVALWCSPDQWLLISDTRSAAQLIDDCRSRLEGVLHNVTDASDELACTLIKGAAGRTLLAMGSGVDFHPARFPAGHCVRTRLAKVAVLILARDGERFELFADRSISHYLKRWLERNARDLPKGEHQ